LEILNGQKVDQQKLTNTLHFHGGVATDILLLPEMPPILVLQADQDTVYRYTMRGSKGSISIKRPPWFFLFYKYLIDRSFF